MNGHLLHHHRLSKNSLGVSFDLPITIRIFNSRDWILWTIMLQTMFKGVPTEQIKNRNELPAFLRREMCVRREDPEPF